MDQDKKSYRKRVTRKRKSKSQSTSQPVRFEEIEAEDGSKKMVEVRRRRRRRSKQPKKEKEKRVKLAKRFLIVGIILIIIIIFSFYFFMITWIGGQGFRKNVSDKISEIIEQDVSFGEFSLKGLNLRSKGFKIDSVPKEFLLLEAKLELLQTRIHPRSFFFSDWSMGNVQSLKGELLFGKDQFDVVDKKFPINDIYNNDGIDSLQKQLKKMDYESYKTIDINNHRRVIRVLSVCIDSGLKYSSFLGKEKKIRKFQSQIYILCEERIKIYDKINERVDKMVENGLEKEAKSLYKFKDSKIFETVGYKEWILYWNRTLSKKKTIEEIKKNTRRYAKRQITWFKKYKKATWLKPNEAIDKILKNYK